MRLIISLPVALVAGLGAGFAFFRGPAPLTAGRAGELRESGASADAASLPDSPAATDAKTQRLVVAALRKGGGIDRDNELYLAIQAFTADDFRRLIADLGALKAMAEKLNGIDAGTAQMLASGLIGRWLAVDPGTVMTWAPRALDLIPVKENARGWILDALAAKRPEEMLALVPSRKTPAERADIISRALRELAAHDPAKAQGWLDACTDPADRRVAEKAFRLGIVQTDPLRAIELARSIDRSEGYELVWNAAQRASKMGSAVLRQLATTPMEPWMLSPVLQQFAETDPELAVELALKDNPDRKSKLRALQYSFSALASRDPEQAIAKLEGIEGPELAAAVSNIGGAWAARDPEAALNWLADRPASERINPHWSGPGGSDALMIAFWSWAESAPADARAWANALPAGSARDAVQAQFARALAKRGDVAEATQILARLGDSAEPRALQDIAATWARSDPGAAADWAIGLEPGPAQNRALAGIVGTWANDDPRSVGDWLAQFPPGEARDRSVAAFLGRGNAWTSGSAEHIAEFDAWFDRIDDPWRRAQAARSSFWQRQRSDPAAARAWLSSLPNADADVIRMTLRTVRN